MVEIMGPTTLRWANMISIMSLVAFKLFVYFGMFNIVIWDAFCGVLGHNMYRLFLSLRVVEWVALIRFLFGVYHY